MSAEAITKSEVETLAALDLACWEDCERGGGGWAHPSEVARIRGISVVWAFQVLSYLMLKGMAERCRLRVRWHRPRWYYAPTEQGADFLISLPSGGTGR